MNHILLAEIDIRDVIWVIAGLALILGWGVFALVVAKRKLFGSKSDGNDDGGFTLADLRQMRDNGRISEEEYNVLRDKIIQDSSL